MAFTCYHYPKVGAEPAQEANPREKGKRPWLSYRESRLGEHGYG